MSFLVVNAGSSSLKLRLLDDDESVQETADLPALGTGSGDAALEATLSGWPRPDHVAHRVVHGGRRFIGAVALDAAVRAQLEELTDLAPLHQPKSLAAIDAVSQLLPDVAAFACFDTAFHSSIPPAASTYAIPRHWRSRYGIRRYGFHGLSHAYCVQRCAQLLDRPIDDVRMVTCHIGAGASLTAIVQGCSVDTTMGFTPLEGVVMATRSGSVDPGLVLWLEEHEGLSPHEVAESLERESGLLALAGTADLREVEARLAAGDERSVLAFEVYAHRLVTGIGAMAAAAGGLDAIAFTGGVGENSTLLRSEIGRRLAFLGIDIDADLNVGRTSDCDISSDSALTRTLVISAREDLQMVREVSALLRR